MTKKARLKKKQYRSYLVLSKYSKRLFGAFPYTEIGFEEAQKYVAKITRRFKEEYIIEPSWKNAWQVVKRMVV